MNPSSLSGYPFTGKKPGWSGAWLLAVQPLGCSGAARDLPAQRHFQGNPASLAGGRLRPTKNISARLAGLLTGLALGLCGFIAEAAQAARGQYLGADYVAYWVDLTTDDVALCWRDDRDHPLESFSRLRAHFSSKSRELKFAINAGIFSRDKTPLGLHIEESKELRALNLGTLEGGQWNFYLKPNGVFFVTNRQAGLLESGEYARLALRPRLACQSGPLLLAGGNIHPEFRPRSPNLYRRSGVGLGKDNRVVFVLTLQPICFHDFATLFKERLACEHALYLDGEICALYLPELGLVEDARSSFVGMFAVTTPAQPASPPPRDR
jgi:uncharacterized protein YigE (DUF2233 family)